MSRTLTALVFGTTLLTGGLALAQQPPGQAQPPAAQEQMPPAESMRTLTLKVKEINRAKNSVVFEAHVKPEAKIYRGNQPLKINALMPGDQVTVAFDPTTGEVLKIQIMAR